MSVTTRVSLWLTATACLCAIYTEATFYYDDCLSKGRGQVVFPPGGIILSPGYGQAPYKSKMDCVWTAEAYPDESIDVEILHLNIEEGSTCEACDHDVIELWEFDLAGFMPDQKIAELCGKDKGFRVYRTHSKGVRIKFRSDSNLVRGDGFSIRVDINRMNASVTDYDFYHDNGTIVSPGYDVGKFPPNMDWFWYVTSPLGQSIHMVVAQMNISYADDKGDCSNGFLRIRDGHSADTGIVKFCGYHSVPMTVQSKANKVSVHFHDSEDVFGYFQITWTFVDEVYNCGENQTGRTGDVVSPRGGIIPGTYPHYMNCTWTVTVDTDKKVELVAQEYWMELSDNCKYDRVVVQDGLKEDSPVLGTYCGTGLNSVRTTGPHMRIRFLSDAVVNDGGFKLKWSEVDNSFTCTFESGTCGMMQSDADHFDWLLNDGTLPDHEGPRAANGSQGNHYYIEATDDKGTDNQTASILTPALGLRGQVCVQFLYHMFGKRVGSLSLFSVAGNGSPETKWWTKEGDQGNKWSIMSVQVTIIDTNTKVGWRATRGAGFRGDVSVDSIVIFSGMCNTPSTIHTPSK